METSGKLTTSLKAHEAVALEECLAAREGMSRYKFLRSLILEELVREGFLKLANGHTMEHVRAGYSVRTMLRKGRS